MPQAVPTTPPPPDASGMFAIPLDFSLGIHSSYPNSATAQTNLRDGAATIENTFGCYALPDGSLGPLPSRVEGQAQTQIPYDLTGHTPGTNYKPSQQPAAYVADALVLSPLFTDSTLALWSADPDGPVVAYDFHYNPSGTGSPYYHYALVRYYQTWRGLLQSKDILFDRSGVTNAIFPQYIGSHGLIRSRSARTYNSPPYLATDLVNFIGVLIQSLQAWVAASTAMPVVDRALTTFDTDLLPANTYPAFGGGSTVLASFPDPASIGGGTNCIPAFASAGAGISNATLIIGHQDRWVAFDMAGTSIGANVEKAIRDSIAYAGANNITRSASPGGPGTTAYLAENPSMVGAAASMTADQLFIVKHNGGGLLIQGSLDQPTIKRLPMIESTYGLTSIAVVSPIGVVYGTRNGVYVYAGGDNAQRLSTQLDGFFWQHELDPTNEKYFGTRGRFGYWNPFICVPNNYLFDTRGGAWWRLEQPDATTMMPYNCYDVSGATNKLYAFHYKLNASWNRAWSTYDWATLRSTYSWQSQPILLTRENRLAFRQFELIAIAETTASTPTVTVTVSGYDETGTLAATGIASFTVLANGRVTYQRKDITPNVNVRYVTVKIVATSVSGPAPRILPGTRLFAADQNRAGKV